MSRPGKRWLGLTVLLLAGALFYLRSETSNSRTSQYTSVTTPKKAPSPEAPRQVPPAEAESRQRGGTIGLPPADAPLAVIMAPLAARADAGDAKAACRVAMELIRCQNTDAFKPVPGLQDSAAEAALVAKGRIAAADRLALREIMRLARLKECLDVPATLRGRAAHYLGQAARAGEPEAMLRYAEGHHWPMDSRGIFANPEFDTWRRDAPGMLRRAFAAGIPEAPFSLMHAYETDSGFLAALIPNDPVRVAAMQRLMVSLHGWRGGANGRNLGAAEAAKARELAEDWHKRLYQGRSYAGQDRSLFQYAGGRSDDGPPETFCSSDRWVR